MRACGPRVSLVPSSKTICDAPSSEVSIRSFCKTSSRTTSVRTFCSSVPVTVRTITVVLPTRVVAPAGATEARMTKRTIEKSALFRAIGDMFTVLASAPLSRCGHPIPIFASLKRRTARGKVHQSHNRVTAERDAQFNRGGPAISLYDRAVAHAASRWRARMSAWRNAGLSTAVLILGLFLYVLDPPILRELQGRFFDVLQELKPREYVPLPVRVVDIDDASLERIGQWPWPRTVLAELVDRLHGLGAAAIAFDLVFAEPDRTSPAHELQHLPNAPDAVSAWLSALPDNDASFASAIAEASVATGFVLTPAGGGHAPLLKAGWTEAGDDPDRFIERFRGAVANLPAIEAASAGNGSLNVTTSRAHVVRQVPMIVAYGNTIYPSLPAEALRLAQHSDSYDVKASGANGATAFGKKTGISEIRIGDLVTETDPSGAITLYDTGVVPRRALPAWRVLEGRVAPQELRDAIVFVGISASGLGDLRPTPVARAMSGAEIQAQIAEQALTQVFLRRPDWARGAELVYLIALGGLLIFALPRIGAGWGALLAGAAVAGAFASAWYSFAALGLLFSPVYPTIVALCVYTTSSLVSQMDTEAEKNRIRHAFGQYLSPVLVAQLASAPSKLRLGGEL